MLAVLLNIAAAIAMIWAAWKCLNLVAYILHWAAIKARIAVPANAAARAARQLPKRDLTLDFTGDKAEAKLFATIVHDRLVRTRMAHDRPAETYAATRLGRRVADQAG